MSLTILTGAISSHDITMGGTSVKCGFGRLAVQIDAQGIASTTFCSNSWVEEKKGMRQASVSMLGYTTKSSVWSDPLVWVGDDAPVAFVGLATTGCSLAFDMNVFSDGMDLVAAFNAGRTVAGRSTGAVTSVWVTT